MPGRTSRRRRGSRDMSRSSGGPVTYHDAAGLVSSGALRFAGSARAEDDEKHEICRSIDESGMYKMNPPVPILAIVPCLARQAGSDT